MSTEWIQLRQSVLASLPSIGAWRDLYADLVLNGSQLSGGCTTWKSFVINIGTALIQYRPIRLTIISFSVLGVAGRVTATCANETVLRDMLTYMLLNTSGSDTSTYACDANSWIVKKCSTIDAQSSLCLDNVNSTGQCAGICDPIERPKLYGGCATESQRGSSDSLRLVVVDYEEFVPAPNITNMTVHSRTRDSLTIELEFDGITGSVACRAYMSSDAYVPSDVQAISSGGTVSDIVVSKATVNLSGLLASSQHDIYCVSYSDANVAMDIAQVLRLKKVHETLCCRQLIVALQSHIFVNSMDLRSAIVVSTNRAPLGLVVKFHCIKDGIDVLDSPFFPSELFFWPAKPVTQLIAAYQSGIMSLGEYELSVSLNGAAASDFVVSYPTGNIFSIVANSTELPPPVMVSAIFSNEGSKIIVTFNSPSDRGGGNNIFSCSQLFSFTGLSVASKCVWKSGRIAEVLPNADIAPVVGNNLTLLPNVLRSQCPSLVPNACSNFQYNSLQIVRVGRPENAVAPVVSISSPQQIGSCSDWVIDLSGSSGSGGRSWMSVTFRVDSLDINSTKVQNYLTRAFISTSRPVTVPNKYLKTETVYVVVVKLCNFLGACGRASHSVVVSGSNSIPIVTLNSKKIRIMTTKTALSLSGEAYTSQCGNAKSYANLVYQWDVYSQGSLLIDRKWKSISVNVKTIQLPPYTFQVGHIYTVRLTVTHLQSQMSSTVSLSVSIEPGAIAVVLTTSSSIGIRMNEGTKVDPSGSYDEDQPNVFGKSAGLVFSFSCTQIRPKYSVTCGLIQEVDSAGIMALSVPEDGNFVGTVHEVMVVVSHPTGNRTASKTVEISILPALAPMVSIHSVTGLRINSNDKVKLVGTVSAPDAGSIMWSWSDHRNIAVMADTPVEKSFSYPSGSASFVSVTTSLVLPPFTLSEDSVFTFQLSCALGSGYSSSAAIVISTNSPPSIGIFEVHPLNGTMLLTYFTFTASRFEDSDIPVSYEYGYESSTGKNMIFRSRLEKSYASTVLPTGQLSSNYDVRCRLRAFDLMNAKTDVFSSVTVFPKKKSSDSIQDFFTTTVSSGGGYADVLKLAIAATVAAVNEINCSNAPDCAALHRQECDTVVATCGQCIQGYVGEAGAGNTACIDDKAGRRLSLKAVQHATCVDDSDCDRDLWEVCDYFQCVTMSRSCANDCYNRGRCNFVSMYNRNISVENCSVLSTDCVAVCTCADGYAGLSCEYTTAEYHDILTVKHTVAVALRNLSLVENVAADTVVAWIDFMSSVSSNPFDLLDDTKELICRMAIDVLSSARTVGLSYEDISGILEVVDFALALSATKSIYRALISAYTSFVMSDMVDGQNPVHASNSLFRISTFSVDKRKSTALSLPMTAIDMLSHTPQQYLLLPETDGIAPLKVSISEVLWTGGLNSSYLSLPLSLKLSSYPCHNLSTAESCRVTFVFQHVRKVKNTDGIVEKFKINCKEDGVNVTYSKTCENGFNVTLSCNGTVAGTLTQKCPVRVPDATCAVLSDALADPNACEVVSASADNTTCSCAIVDINKNHQQHEDFEQDNEEIFVDYGAVLNTVKHDFVSNWKSAGSLTVRDVGKNILVLLTIMGLAVAAVVFLFLGHVMDRRSRLHATLELRRASMQQTNSSPTNYPAATKLRRMIPGINRGQSRVMSESRLAIRQQLDKIEESLPNVLRTEPMVDRFVAELKQYHRWLGVIYFYSPNFPRALRVLSLASNICIMMFVEAVTYNFADPDDGHCEDQRTQEECLKRPSVFNNQQSMCIWHVARSECAVRDISDDLQKVMVVVIVSAALSAPLALSVQLLISQVLSMKTSEVPSPHITPVNSADAVNTKESGPAGRQRSNVIPQATLLADYRKLTDDIVLFRQRLTQTELDDFDDAWGLNANKMALSDRLRRRSLSLDNVGLGRLSHCLSFFKRRESPEERLLHELARVLSQARFESRLFDNPLVDTDTKRQRLLYLFTRDLLQGINGMILDSKNRRNNPLAKRVSIYTKLAGWIFLILLDLALLLYIYLFALSQSAARQKAWFFSFILWIGFEIFVVSTLVVLIMHVIIPSVIMRDVNAIKKKILNDVLEYEKQVHRTSSGLCDAADNPTGRDFNAASYLFVSSKVAASHLEHRESAIILRFTTPWPKQSFKRSKQAVSESYDRKFSFVFQAASRILLFFLTGLLSCPEIVQDGIVQIVSTLGLGTTMLFFARLYTFHPVLPFTPLLFVLALVGWIVYNNQRLFEEAEEDICGVERPEEKEGEKPPTQPSSSLKKRRESLLEGQSMAVNMLQTLEAGDYTGEGLDTLQRQSVDGVSLEKVNGHSVGREHRRVAPAAAIISINTGQEYCKGKPDDVMSSDAVDELLIDEMNSHSKENTGTHSYSGILNEADLLQAGPTNHIDDNLEVVNSSMPHRNVTTKNDDHDEYDALEWDSIDEMFDTVVEALFTPSVLVHKKEVGKKNMHSELRIPQEVR